MPIHGLEMFEVAVDQAVGADHDVVLRDFLDEFSSAKPFGSVMNHDIQPGAEFFDFSLPVADQRHRHDEQRGARGIVLLAFVKKQGDELNGFPQTHVIG